MSEKWKCDLGNGEFDHDWKYVTDSAGDPGVIGGTFSFGYWQCRVCGEEDLNREPPERGPEDDL